MVNFLKKRWFGHKLKQGLGLFERTGITSVKAYEALRKMFVLTGGKSNDKISNEISKRIGKYERITARGVLGDLSDLEMNRMIDSMRRDGYYIFENQLSEELVNELYNHGLTVPCCYLDIDKNVLSEEKVIFDPEHPISPRYQFLNDSIVNLPVVQKLLFDESLLAFAQEYLGTKPILDLIAFWWSIPFSGKGKSAAAQMYHFDMDRIKFFKFFFYITDVDTNNGPHCYVKGSHLNLPKNIIRDGRFTDEEIEKIYGADRLFEICGKKGAIMAVDTRGFHKGKELLNGTRLIFQIEFANSMFGQTYPPVPIKFINDEIEIIAKRRPYTYNQIMIWKNQEEV